MKQEFADLLKNWNPELQLTVKARFLKKGSLKPVYGSHYLVRLYDKDLFTDDDYLGAANLNEHGEAHIHFYPSDLNANDVLPENAPDLYLLLFKDDTVHFQSKVWNDVDFTEETKLNLKEGSVLDFGTFLVD